MLFSTYILSKLFLAEIYGAVLAGSVWLLWRSWLKAARFPKYSIVSFEKLCIAWKRMFAFQYLFNYSKMLERAYILGRPFSVCSPEAEFLHVYSEDHVEELADLPEDRFSLFALAEDLLQPRYTMNGFHVMESEFASTSLQYRVLRTKLTADLPFLQEMLLKRIVIAFEVETSRCRTSTEEYMSIPTFSLAKSVLRSATSFAIFGDELASDPDFLEAAMQFPEEVFRAGEIIRYLPTFMAGSVARWITNDHRACNIMIQHLTATIEARLVAHQIGKPKNDTPHDCIQWVIETAPRKDPWPVSRTIHVVLGLWWASIYQLSMTASYALYDLCDHPEYLDPLRQESAHAHLNYENMPLLDSFLRESARLHPTDTVSIRRKALAPHTFQDGTHIQSGQWICAPSRAIMRDAKNYNKPEEFDGFRFAQFGPQKDMAPSSLPNQEYADADTKFLFWGYGKRACPGRFYASCVLKLLMAHIVSDYDFKMENPAARRSFEWRAAVIPDHKTRLLIRKRHLEES